jgi:hypothetical protein
MHVGPRLLALALCLVVLPPHRLCAGPDDEDEIPVVGRPAELPFSDASGDFCVKAEAEPTVLQAEDPLTLTVRVTAVGLVRHPPRRIDLRQVPAFTNSFFIEDPEDGGARHPDNRTWEFVYLLKPRSADVTEVPSCPFVFYNPAIVNPSRRFQTLFTDPIPLQVQPRTAFQTPLAAPEEAYTLAPVRAVLGQQSPWAPPGPLGLAGLLLAPPLGCAAWYLVWRRLYPDAARAARQRRSRAAKLALKALRFAPRGPADRSAVATASIVADYLHQRLDLAVREPTPIETATYLRRVGLPPALAEQGERFFQGCDAARFRPAPSADGSSLKEVAVQFILAVEAETWASAHS